MSKYLVFAALILIMTSCQEKPMDAQSIIDQSIEVYGGEKVYKSTVKFDFRDIAYTGMYNYGNFSWERVIQNDSLGQIQDVLNNDGFTRTINGEGVELDEEWTGKYSRSVNSVLYFFRVPFNLNDGAVNKELIGESEINGKSYYKVKVTFSEEGGGEDFDDAFVYWFGKEDFIIDYLAYSYSTDGGGKRFRKMINPRDVNGLKVVDFVNYKPKDLEVNIEDYDQYFQENGMEELSRIINENVSIEYM